MPKKFTTLFFICSILISSFCSLIFAKEWSATELVDEANKLLRGQSSHTRIEMKIETPSWKRTLDVETWNQGREKALMRIHGPAKERGNGTLKITREIWNWLPQVERTVKIPPSMMHSSWMGSDFTYEDIAKADSVVKDYTHKILEKKSFPDKTLYRIEATPKPDAPVVWGKIILEVLVDSEGILPTIEEDYSERMELMRKLSFSDVTVKGGRRIPTRVECVPLRKRGHKTSIIYHEFKVDISFPENFFSLQNLQKPL